MLVLFLILGEHLCHFFIMTIIIYVFANNTQEFPFLHILVSVYYLCFLITTTFTGVKWCYCGFIFHFPDDYWCLHFIMYLFAFIHFMSSFENYLFRPIKHFQLGYVVPFVFLLSLIITCPIFQFSIHFKFILLSIKNGCSLQVCPSFQAFLTKNHTFSKICSCLGQTSVFYRNIDMPWGLLFCVIVYTSIFIPILCARQAPCYWATPPAQDFWGT